MTWLILLSNLFTGFFTLTCLMLYNMYRERYNRMQTYNNLYNWCMMPITQPMYPLVQLLLKIYLSLDIDLSNYQSLNLPILLGLILNNYMTLKPNTLHTLLTPTNKNKNKYYTCMVDSNDENDDYVCPYVCKNYAMCPEKYKCDEYVYKDPVMCPKKYKCDNIIKPEVEKHDPDEPIKNYKIDI